MIGTHKTTIRKENNKTIVRYHNTDIVTIDWIENYKDDPNPNMLGMITLNTGGWFTQTTKARMNQVSEVFNLGYRVFQKNYKWYVELDKYTTKYIPFWENTAILECNK